MFLRKLLVIVVPLAFVLAFALIFPLLSTLGLFRQILAGLLLGISLALVIPLSGATRRKGPFASLLWIPAVLLAFIVLYQYLHAVGAWRSTLLEMFAVSDGQVILAECAMVGYLVTESVRTA